MDTFIFTKPSCNVSHTLCLFHAYNHSYPWVFVAIILKVFQIFLNKTKITVCSRLDFEWSNRQSIFALMKSARNSVICFIYFSNNCLLEVLNNLFLTTGVQFKKLISSKQPDGFANLYIPGFNKVLTGNGGFGFNYTISYLIPFYKK